MWPTPEHFARMQGETRFWRICFPNFKIRDYAGELNYGDGTRLKTQHADE